MDTIAAAPADVTAQAVIDAARNLAAVYRDIPGGYRRLHPALVALIDASLAHDRAGATR